jgi:hypothetical protein
VKTQHVVPVVRGNQQSAHGPSHREHRQGPQPQRLIYVR